jgi:hypothetical protein
MPTMPFTKINEDEQIVYGWASVITVKGEPVLDWQEDIIEPAELRKAAHDFMQEARHAGLLHVLKRQIGTVVESVVLTADVQKALGIDLGQEGWFIGVKVENKAVWKMIKDGELRAFSIGGHGERTPIDKAGNP